MSTLDQRFGAALQRLREQAGKTQEEIGGGRTYVSELERGLKTPTLDTIVKLAAELNVTPARLVELATTNTPAADRSCRDALTFLVADKRPPQQLRYARDGKDDWCLQPSHVLGAMQDANRVLARARDVLAAESIQFFELLGTRNLGSFVGAVFVQCLHNHEMNRLRINGHQDGYPDLCALTAAGKRYIAEKEKEGLGDAKKTWASYPEGGVEVKTTCGNVPTATKKRKKPGIGDPRTEQLTGLDWKAHHRQTNNLLGLYWDFLDQLPTLLAAFYRNDLSPADWGEMILPQMGQGSASVEEAMGEEIKVEQTIEAKKPTEEKKKSGGRTTSVSIVTRAGVEKMGKGWLVLPANATLLRYLCRPTILNLSSSDILPHTSREVSEELRAVLNSEVPGAAPKSPPKKRRRTK